MKTLKQILLGGVRKDEIRRVEEPAEKKPSDVICYYDTMSEEEKREEREWIYNLPNCSEKEKMAMDYFRTYNREQYISHSGTCPECGAEMIVIVDKDDLKKTVGVCTFCSYME